MTRTLKEVLDRLPPERRLCIETRTQELIAEEISFRKLPRDDPQKQSQVVRAGNSVSTRRIKV
jgi:hypothetical protein